MKPPVVQRMNDKLPLIINYKQNDTQTYKNQTIFGTTSPFIKTSKAANKRISEWNSSSSAIVQFCEFYFLLIVLVLSQK